MGHSGGVTDATIIADLSGPSPYPTLRQLREDQPVRRLDMPDGARVWLVSRYEDAGQALGDPRLSKKMQRGCPAAVAARSAITCSTPTARYTGCAGSSPRLHRAGSPARAAHHHHRQLLDDMARTGVDLVDAFASRCPSR